MMRTLIPPLIALLLLLGGCTEPDRPSVPLYLAVQRGDLDQVERHIYWGSDINAALPDGHHPLHTAAANGRIIMVRLLLKHGAEIDRALEDGTTPIDLAILAGRTQVAELLLSRGAQLDPSALLLRAAEGGATDRDIVRFLIARGADTERRNDNGDTPLLLAIRQRNHRLAAHLVDQGADVNVATPAGVSALALARELQLPELISLLERQGAR